MQYSVDDTGEHNDAAGRPQPAERRRHRRQRIEARAEISNPTFGRYRVRVRDISDSGLFLELGTAPVPPLGTELQVTVWHPAGAPGREPMTARVVRHEALGIGLAFVAGVQESQ
jgi:hypothetical protein